MLNDSYVEQVVKSKPGMLYVGKLALSIVITMLGLVSVLFIGLIGVVIFGVGVCLFYVFWSERKIEYEYILTNGSVEVAAIYNATKRKNLISFDVEQISMIVPKDSQRLGGETFAKKRDYTSRQSSEGLVAFVVDTKNRKELVLLEPNERVLAHMKTYARNKMHDL